MQSFMNGNRRNVSHSLQGNSDVKPLEKEDIVRLMRLILESLEVSIHLCNTFLNSFGPSRLMDILDQLLPTAYVVNTAYWPLYQTETGDSICICNIFNINCPHMPGGLSWIDLDRPINESVNFKEGNGNITLTDLHMIISKEVSKILYINSAGCADYKYSKMYEIYLKFKTKNCWIDAIDDFEDNVIKCQLRFELVKPKLDFNTFCLWLTPHPLFNPLYGKHFSCLLDNVLFNVYPNSLIVTWDKCPKYTLRITEKYVVKDWETLRMEDVGLDGCQRP
ncbi:uncharacterized protein LOC108916431 isoform X2 [Anoplophora glabripennis]|uniref:uncharacterized protein LOC108916431 isoform X2 n=1 Tax=Anoplophora glabripennis TaxID=217634 RepID=UPI000873D19A|nr:uncharacterized protein LOC108916431 isoform X2 [Anoplophora glabripennis]